MHARVRVFGTAAALAIALGPAAAAGVALQEQESEGGQAEEDARALRRLPAFGALDADDDGEISAGEIDAAAESLATLDEDADGALSGDELRPRGGGPIGGPARTPPEATAAFLAFDADGNGALEGAELPSQLRSLLSRADADGDGAASGAEILALMTAEAAGPGDEEEPETDAGGEQSADAGDDRGSSRPRSPLMAALDADGDGTVSVSEIASAARGLRALDASGDGRLTADELRPAPGGESDSGGRQE